MKKLLVVFVLVLASVFFMPGNDQQPSPQTVDAPKQVRPGKSSVPAPKPAFAPATSDTGQSLVRITNKQSLQRFMALNHLSKAQVQPSKSLPKTYIVAAASDELRTDGVSVSPRRHYQAQFTFTDQDPIYPQWYTDKIEAPLAWNITTGDSDITVAVIDTGFALNHEDLEGRWAGGGKDFVNTDDDPQAGTDDPTGIAVNHGTRVAGLVGATGNNGKGVASINWAARLLPLQALDDNGSGFTDDVVAAVDYAVTQGVDVINLSLGSTEEDPLLTIAINNAVSLGVTVVAAAGNCGDSGYEDQGCSTQGQMLYPAKQSNVIAVGATTSSDARAAFSSYGSQLDVVAPGSGTIRTTTWLQSNQTTAYNTSLSGTSFASPIVAGLAASQLAVDPAQTPAQIRQKLIANADEVSGMSGDNFTTKYGYGRINAYNTIGSYTWPESANAFRLIQCDGQNYMVERSIRSKRLLSAEAIAAWNFGSAVYSVEDNGCDYPTYSLPLEPVVRAKGTNVTYLVDSQKAYRLQSASIARAWGFEDQFDAASSDIAKLKLTTIQELDIVSKLPRLATAIDTTVTYLLDGGEKYPILGTPGDDTALRLFHGNNVMPRATFSAALLAALADATTIDYSFRSGGNWYVTGFGKIHKIHSNYVDRWTSHVGDGPTLSADITAIIPKGSVLSRGFQRSEVYYRVTMAGVIEQTGDASTAELWGVLGSPVVSSLLITKLTD